MSDDESEQSSIPQGGMRYEEWIPIMPTIDRKKYPQLRPRSIEPFSMIVCSSRNMGKSTFLKDFILKNKMNRKYDLILLFSKTLGNGFYEKFLDTKLVYKKFDEAILTNLDAVMEEHKATKGFYLNTLVIFDDMIGQRTLHNEALSDLYTLGRHKGASVIYLTQNPTMANVTWRQNTTHLVLLETRGRGLSHIIDGFLFDIADEDDAEADGYKNVKTWLRKQIKIIHSEPYRAMIVLFDEQGRSVKDCVRWYKADLH